jgi:hypothetical protein
MASENPKQIYYFKTQENVLLELTFVDDIFKIKYDDIFIDLNKKGESNDKIIKALLKIDLHKSKKEQPNISDLEIMSISNSGKINPLLSLLIDNMNPNGNPNRLNLRFGTFITDNKVFIELEFTDVNFFIRPKNIANNREIKIFNAEDISEIVYYLIRLNNINHIINLDYGHDGSTQISLCTNEGRSLSIEASNIIDAFLYHIGYNNRNPFSNHRDFYTNFNLEDKLLVISNSNRLLFELIFNKLNMSLYIQFENTLDKDIKRIDNINKFKDITDYLKKINDLVVVLDPNIHAIREPIPLLIDTKLNPIINKLIIDLTPIDWVTVDDHDRKYLKYKNKYIQLKNKLKV